MTSTWLANASISSMRCEVKITVLPAALTSLQQVQELVAGRGVQVRGRLIQHQDRRVGQQRQPQGQPLLHAAGQRAHPLAGVLGQADLGQHLASALAGDALEAGIEQRRVQRTQVVVEGQLLRHVAQQTAHRLALLVGVQAVDRDLPIVAQQAQQALDGRGLAGAVGAPERDRLPRLDQKAEVVDGRELAELLGEVRELDHGTCYVDVL